MTRGVPVSLLIHALILTALFVLGGQVSQPPPRERVMRVRLASLPRPQATEPQARPTEPPAETASASPTSEPEPVELEPKTVPEPPRREPPPRETEPERRPPSSTTEENPPPEEMLVPRNQQGAASADSNTATGPRVATGVDFPFVYYVDLIERRVSRQWHPPPLDSYRGRPRVCEVQFVIERGGGISRVTLATTSGVGFFDREALAAVKAASPLPPLPAKYGDRELPVSIRFTLSPGF